MQLPRFVGLVDLGIATVIAVAVVLPAREMFAAPAIKGDEAQQFAVALAEARTIARPDDGFAVEEFARRLGEAGMKDWAVESAIAASERAMGSPTRWRALIAASVAYVDRLDVIPGLDYANRALAECSAARDRGSILASGAACPTWEEVRMRLYQQNLDAGVKSGIDPHRDPRGFRHAEESALRQIHLGAQHDQLPVPAGSGSAGIGSGSAH